MRRLTIGGFLLAVLGLSFWILPPFLPSLAWAAMWREWLEEQSQPAPDHAAT